MLHSRSALGLRISLLDSLQYGPVRTAFPLRNRLDQRVVRVVVEQTGVGAEETRVVADQLGNELLRLRTERSRQIEHRVKKIAVTVDMAVEIGVIPVQAFAANHSLQFRPGENPQSHRHRDALGIDALDEVDGLPHRLLGFPGGAEEQLDDVLEAMALYCIDGALDVHGLERTPQYFQHLFAGAVDTEVHADTTACFHGRRQFIRKRLRHAVGVPLDLIGELAPDDGLAERNGMRDAQIEFRVVNVKNVDPALHQRLHFIDDVLGIAQAHRPAFDEWLDTVDATAVAAALGLDADLPALGEVVLVVDELALVWTELAQRSASVRGQRRGVDSIGIPVDQAGNVGKGSSLFQASQQLGEAEFAFAHDAKIGAQVLQQFFGHDREAGTADHDGYRSRASKRRHDVANLVQEAVATGKVNVIGVSERHAPVVRRLLASVRVDRGIAVLGETEVEQRELETRPLHGSRQVIE